METNSDPLIAYCFDTFVKTIYPMEEKLEDTKKSQYYKQPVSICGLRYITFSLSIQNITFSLSIQNSRLRQETIFLSLSSIFLFRKVCCFNPIIYRLNFSVCSFARICSNLSEFVITENILHQ